MGTITQGPCQQREVHSEKYRKIPQELTHLRKELIRRTKEDGYQP